MVGELVGEVVAAAVGSTVAGIGELVGDTLKGEYGRGSANSNGLPVLALSCNELHIRMCVFAKLCFKPLCQSL